MAGLLAHWAFVPSAFIAAGVTVYLEARWNWPNGVQFKGKPPFDREMS